MVTTIPWHVTGLLGDPRRVASFDYTSAAAAGWGWLTIISVAGAALMLIAAVLFLLNLVIPGPQIADRTIRYAVALNPPERLPAVLNGFAVWNAIFVLIALVAYGFPLARYLLPAIGSAVASVPP
jgi:cytochrome c oxidase subunit 1